MEQRDTATNRLRYFAIVNFVLLLSLNSGKASFAVVLGFFNSRCSKWLITLLLATFVLTHLLMQLGNGHASMPAALVLVNNHSCSGSTSFDFIRANQFLEAPLICFFCFFLVSSYFLREPGEKSEKKHNAQQPNVPKMDLF